MPRIDPAWSRAYRLAGADEVEGSDVGVVPAAPEPLLEGPPEMPLSVVAPPPVVGLFSSDAAAVDPLVAAGGGVAAA